MVGNLSVYELVLVLLVLLVAAAVPIALAVWAVRALGGSRRREADLLRRVEALEALEALEADRHAPRRGAT